MSDPQSSNVDVLGTAGQADNVGPGPEQSVPDQSVPDQSVQNQALPGVASPDEAASGRADIDVVVGGSADVETDSLAGGADVAAGDRASDGEAASRLEEEGDVAADYLEELLDILDLDGDIDIDVENGRASVSVGDASAARSLRRLVGAEGEVLDALQELTRLAVQTKTGDRTRLMLDIAGFRKGRRRELESLAAETVERVRSDGEPIALDAMSPFERKVIHDVVADAGLRSESEGEGGGRHVVVHPVPA